MKHFAVIAFIFLVYRADAKVWHKKLPEKLVVLTFDDAILSHATLVAPLLRKYSFGATFFISEFPPDFSDKSKYMTWHQIKKLSKMGFEIGNHTQNHRHVHRIDRKLFTSELDSIELRCKQYGIAKPQSFAYPGFDTNPSALPVLSEKGYRYARAGGNRPYNPLKDNPLLIPSFNASGDNKEKVLDALKQARAGEIIVLTIHGVPDRAHAQVSTPPELFEEYLQFLKSNKYKVIALRDLIKYIDMVQASKIIPVFSAYQHQKAEPQRMP
jgi:peptidoglycan-N-acetylglucosamine deacetylase